MDIWVNYWKTWEWLWPLRGRPGGLAFPVNQQDLGFQVGSGKVEEEGKIYVQRWTAEIPEKSTSGSQRRGLLWIHLRGKTREEASSEINRLWAQNLDAIISLRTLPSESLLCAKYINKLCHPHNGYIRRTVPSIKTWLGCLWAKTQNNDDLTPGVYSLS